MKSQMRYAVSGIRSILFLTVLGCLLAGGLASAILESTLAAQDPSRRLNPKPGQSSYKSSSQASTYEGDLTSVLHPIADNESVRFSASPDQAGHVIADVDGHSVCRDATEAEASESVQRDPEQPLHAIHGEESSGLSPAQSQDGLKIVLRGTSQLEEFSEAKAAFIRAAKRWEAVIQSPITVVIDMDFGPTWFGEPFPGPRLGYTYGQTIGANNAYPELRSALLLRASSAQE